MHVLFSNKVFRSSLHEYFITRRDIFYHLQLVFLDFFHMITCLFIVKYMRSRLIISFGLA